MKPIEKMNKAELDEFLSKSLGLTKMELIFIRELLKIESKYKVLKQYTENFKTTEESNNQFIAKINRILESGKNEIDLFDPILVLPLISKSYKKRKKPSKKDIPPYFYMINLGDTSHSGQMGYKYAFKKKEAEKILEDCLDVAKHDIESYICMPEITKISTSGKDLITLLETYGGHSENG